MASSALTLCIIAVTSFTSLISALKPCPGDTRGNKQCNFDSTHRVCAKIGVPGTSFWKFTKQKNWCNTRGDYEGDYGNDLRCPATTPTWCICKWATARWIEGQGCDESIQFDCDATDVCDLKSSYIDFRVKLEAAHKCMAKKCPKQWEACPKDDGKLTVRKLHRSYGKIFWRTRNRNSASHLWAAHVIDNAQTLTEAEIIDLFGGFCPVSGSIVRPNDYNRWSNLKVQSASDPEVELTASVHVCCWPCICDIQEFVKVDTMNIKTKEGTKTFKVFVIGDPCVDKSQIPSEATELRCKDKKLVGAKTSSNGHIVIGMVQPSSKRSNNDARSEKNVKRCEGRKSSGYKWGMGKIFVNIAKINPIHEVAQSKVQQELCENNARYDQNCEWWAERYCDSERFGSWMKKNCTKSCCKRDNANCDCVTK